MRWHYLILLPTIFSFISCGRGPGATAPWTTDANRVLMGSSSPSVSTSPLSDGNALLSITGVECSADGQAYLADVAWVTTLDNVGFAQIEYEISGAKYRAGSGGLRSPIVAEEISETSTAGSTTISIPADEVKKAGDKILVRVVVGSIGKSDATSPVDVYEVNQLCSDTEIPITEGVELEVEN